MNEKLLFRVDVVISGLMCIAMLYASYIVLTDTDIPALLSYLVGANMLLSVLIFLSTRKESNERRNT